MKSIRQSHPAHVKARSRRGWTSPSPAEVAKAEQAKLAEQRKAGKAKLAEQHRAEHEARRQANAAQHEEWLYKNAKALSDPRERLNFLTDNGASPSLSTKIMERIATE